MCFNRRIPFIGSRGGLTGYWLANAKVWKGTASYQSAIGAVASPYQVHQTMDLIWT